MQRPSTPFSERQDLAMNLFCRLTKNVGTHLLLESQSAKSARDDAATSSDARTVFGTQTLSPAGHTSIGHALKELAMSVGSTGVHLPPSVPAEASGRPIRVHPPAPAPPLACHAAAGLHAAAGTHRRWPARRPLACTPPLLARRATGRPAVFDVRRCFPRLPFRHRRCRDGASRRNSCRSTEDARSAARPSGGTLAARASSRRPANIRETPRFSKGCSTSSGSVRVRVLAPRLPWCQLQPPPVVGPRSAHSIWPSATPQRSFV